MATIEEIDAERQQRRNELADRVLDQMRAFEHAVTQAKKAADDLDAIDGSNGANDMIAALLRRLQKDLA